MLNAINVKKVSILLFQIIVLLALFDGIRTRVPSISWMTYFKELSVGALLIILLIKKYKIHGFSLSLLSRKEIMIANIPTLLFLLIVGSIAITTNNIPSILDLRPNPSDYTMHFKTIESFFIILLFINYQFITSDNFKNIIKFFLYGCIAYTLINTFLFFFASTDIVAHPWYGRLSVGYPPTDTQALCFAIAILLFSTKNIFSTKSFHIILAILVFEITLSNTATGFLTLICLILLYAIKYKISKSIKMDSFIFIVFIISAFFASSMSWQYDRLIREKSSYIILKMPYGENLAKHIYNKSSINRWNNADSTTIDSMTIDSAEFSFSDLKIASESENNRKRHTKYAFSMKNDFTSLLLGGPISMGKIPEIELIFFLRSYGIIATILLLLWQIGLVLIAKINNKNTYGVIAVIIIWNLSGLSAITTYMFTISALFALSLAYFIQYDDEE